MLYAAADDHWPLGLRVVEMRRRDLSENLSLKQQVVTLRVVRQC